MTLLSILIHIIVYSLRPPPPHVIDHLPWKRVHKSLIPGDNKLHLSLAAINTGWAGLDWPLSRVVLVSSAPSTASLVIRGERPFGVTYEAAHHQYLCLLYILATREVISCTWHIYDAARELLGRQHSWAAWVEEGDEEWRISDTLVTDT